jgi:glycosyltransferase involved in cell wall biosynthesis
MKLLVLAQTPPPLHGQSVMVQALVTGLPDRGISVHHVNLALSRDATDIGRWRWGKVAAVFDACFYAVLARFQDGCDTLYYVPAPAKRGALYRDWMVLLFCRPFFKRLVLHWHAAGLGEWLATEATAPERWLTKLFLGRADLSLVLGEALRKDIASFGSRRVAVVRNGIVDPCPGFARPPGRAGVTRTAVFLGMIVPAKGVLDAIEAIGLANAGTPAQRWQLVLAGVFPDPKFAGKISALARASGGTIRLVGFVFGPAKHDLLAQADALVFPTHYGAETQGLVVAEALAYDLPLVITGWRAVAEGLPASHVHVVPPRTPVEIAHALSAIAQSAPPAGALRRHFLVHYTREAFLARLAAALTDGPYSRA